MECLEQIYTLLKMETLRYLRKEGGVPGKSDGTSELGLFA